MINSLDDFKVEYKKIQSMGWIRTHRSGNTGIGKTLEDLLGIPENNLHEPDFGKYELKAGRAESNSMLTLFTFNPELSEDLKKGFKEDYGLRAGNSFLRIKYGYASGDYENDEKILHTTLSTKDFAELEKTGLKMKISYDKDNFFIEVNDGCRPVYWSRKALEKQFNEKYVGSFVYARASSKGKGKKEEFQYKEAYEVCGFTLKKFISLLEKGDVKVDVRIGQHHKGKDKGKIHDHGTAFRIKINDHKKLFKEIL